MRELTIDSVLIFLFSFFILFLCLIFFNQMTKFSRVELPKMIASLDMLLHLVNLRRAHYVKALMYQRFSKNGVTIAN